MWLKSLHNINVNKWSRYAMISQHLLVRHVVLRSRMVCWHVLSSRQVQVSLNRVAVCVSESCWRITLSSMCPMWLMSWAASTSSPPRWCPVSLWTRPTTFLRSSGMRFERHGLDTSPSHSTIYTCALPRRRSLWRPNADLKPVESHQHVSS